MSAVVKTNETNVEFERFESALDKAGFIKTSVMSEAFAYTFINPKQADLVFARKGDVFFVRTPLAPNDNAIETHDLRRFELALQK